MDAKLDIQIHWYLFASSRDWGRDVRPREVLLVSCALSTYVMTPRESIKLQCYYLGFVCEATLQI